jgi:hypothetical protein
MLKMSYPISFTPTDDISTLTMTWSIPEQREQVKQKEEQQKQKEKEKIFTTLSEEVWDLTQEWYSNQGLFVPKDEMMACLADIKEEKKEKEKPIQVAKGGFDSTPEYGSKEFWAQVWAKKKVAGYVSKKEQKEKEKQKKE